MALQQCRVGKGEYKNKEAARKANPGVPDKRIVMCGCCRKFYVKK